MILRPCFLTDFQTHFVRLYLGFKMRGLLLSLEEAFFYFQYFCKHNTMLYSCAFLLLVFMVILGALIALGDLR